MARIKSDSGRGPFVRRDEMASGPSAIANKSPATNDEFAKIWIRNETGAARMPFDVVQLGDSVIDPTVSDDAESSFYARVAVKVEEIDEDGTSKVGILLQPLDENDGGRALITGAGVVRLTGDTGKDFATTVSGEYALEAADAGPFEILYDPGPSDEERFAYVRFGSGNKILIGKTNSSVTAPNTVEVSIWSGDDDDLADDTGNDVTAFSIAYDMDSGIFVKLTPYSAISGIVGASGASYLAEPLECNA